MYFAPITNIMAIPIKTKHNPAERPMVRILAMPSGRVEASFGSRRFEDSDVVPALLGDVVLIAICIEPAVEFVQFSGSGSLPAVNLTGRHYDISQHCFTYF